MTNQAAQTMPWIQERELIRAALCKELDTNIESDERTYTIAVRAANALHWRQIEIDQLKAQVAALSQTAGVSEGPDWRYTAVSALEYINAGDAENAASMLRSAIDLSSAAPAASGGESHPDALPDGTLSKSTAKRVEALSSNPNPVTPGLSSESGASVNERAREVDAPIERLRKIRVACGELSAMVGDGPHREHMAIISGQASLAIEQLQREQALTQQRGSEPCLYVKPRLVEILHKLGPAQTEHRVMVSTVPDAQYTVCLSTTPQPGAEALRELVQRWRDEAAEIDARGLACNSNSIRARADELESLLARGA